MRTLAATTRSLASGSKAPVQNSPQIDNTPHYHGLVNARNCAKQQTFAYERKMMLNILTSIAGLLRYPTLPFNNHILRWRGSLDLPMHYNGRAAN